MVTMVRNQTGNDPAATPSPGDRIGAWIAETRATAGTAQHAVFDAVWSKVLEDEAVLHLLARDGLLGRIRSYGNQAKAPVIAALRQPNPARGVRGAAEYIQNVKDTLYETFEIGKGLLLGEATRADLRSAIYQAAGQTSGHMVRLQFLRQLEKRMTDDTTKVAAAIPLKDAEMLYRSTEKAVSATFDGRLVSDDPPLG